MVKDVSQTEAVLQAQPTGTLMRMHRSLEDRARQAKLPSYQ